MRLAPLIATTCTLVLAAQARADVATYECQMTPSVRNSVVADFIFIGHDRDEGRIVASDEIILYFNDGTPVEARIVTDNARRITFAWELRLPFSGGMRARTQYRLTYQKAGGSAMATARPLGFDEVFQAGGQCTLKTQKTLG